MRAVTFFIYRLFLPIIVLLGLPAWVLKMYRRGGFGSGLLERVGLYNSEAPLDFKGAIYIHAVSVGEVLIALKLIDQWLAQDPNQRFILVPTTATGHALAFQRANEYIHVVYSPLDFKFLVRKVFARFSPSLIILIESEMWPNFLEVAEENNLPVTMVNARLSGRSERRYQKVKPLIQPLFAMLDAVCVQEESDIARYVGLGVSRKKVHLTGSIKFDQAGAIAPQKRKEFGEMLESFGRERVIALGISTFVGEEVLLAEAVRDANQKTGSKALCVITPRHAERRGGVKAALEKAGFAVALRSDGVLENEGESQVFVIDSTGELRDWTAHADLVVIGKSFFDEQGGQNPAEAIAVSVPVICGPYMQNFQALVDQLKQVGGVKQVKDGSELAENIGSFLENREVFAEQSAKALAVLKIHQNATSRTVEYLKASFL